MQTRITPPRAVPKFVIRSSIIDSLETANNQTISLVAPAGYGKTIVASQWALIHANSTVWYSASVTDTAKDLVFHIAASLHLLNPDFAHWIEKYFDVQFDPALAISDLVNEIKKIDFPIRLIIDDAQNIINENAKHLILLAQLAPKNLITLTISNNETLLDNLRSAVNDSVILLNEADLIFNENEIKALCMNYSVDYQKNNKVFNTTKNWPAGVLMTLESLRKDAEIVGVDFLDKSLIIEGYLKNLNSAVYEILESLVYFDYLSLNEVSKILENQEKLVIFLGLAQEGFVVTQSGNSEKSFELNNLIKNAIIKRLKSNTLWSNEILINTIAAEISVEKLFEAIFHLEQAGKRSEAKSLLKIQIRRSIRCFDFDALFKNMEFIENTLEIGTVARELINTYVSIAKGSPDGISTNVLLLENHAIATGVIEEVRSDLLVMKSRLALGNGNLSKLLEMNNASAHTFKSPFSLRMAANAAFLMEDYEELLKIVAESRTILNPDLSESVIHLPAIEALLALTEGRLLDALPLSLSVIEETKRSGAVGIYELFDMVYCAAEVLRETGQEIEAISLIESYEKEVKKFHVSSWEAALEAKWALIEAQQGYLSDAINRIGQLRDRFNDSKYDEDLFRIIDEKELIIRLLAKDFERMKKIISRTPDRPTVAFLSVFFEMQKGLAAGKSAVSSLKTRNPRELLLYNLLLVIIELNNPKNVEIHIQETIKLVTTYGFHQILLMQDNKFQEFILTYAENHPTIYLEQLSRLIQNKMFNQKKSIDEVKNPLTKRENEILTRLLTGQSMSQIAANFNISTNTMKTHIKNIYKKLGVDCRKDAVEKGRELLLF